MNNFVKTFYNKFLESTLTYSEKIVWQDSCNEIKFRIEHIVSPKEKCFLLFVEAICKKRKLDLRQSNIILNIDGKNITLSDCFGAKDPDAESEQVNYVLSQEQLLTLCNAQQIDFMLEGQSSSITGSLDDDMQFACKCMYNALIDENMFAEEIANKGDVIRLADENDKPVSSEKRPSPMKMNKFVHTEYDKFSELTITMSNNITWQEEGHTGNTENRMLIKHYSHSNFGQFALRIERYTLERLSLAEGKLILNVDGKNISLTARRVAEDSQYLECVEYDLTQEQLLILCNSEQIDFKLIGQRYYVLGILDKNMQFECKCMYNAIVDGNMFAEDLNEVVERENAKERRDKEIRKTEIVLIAIIVGLVLFFLLIGMLC